MESSIPLKKPRLELNETLMKKRDNDVRHEEIVELMDVVDNKIVSPLCENESEVKNNTAQTINNSTSSDELTIEKACQSSEIPSEDPVAVLFQKYFMASGKKSNNLSLKSFGPEQYHTWGYLSKIKENSCTLRKLTNVNLENVRNNTETFMTILKELEFEYNVIELPPCKEKEKKKKTKSKPIYFQYIFAFDIKSNPKYSFCGCGSTKDIAIELAAKDGLAFFVASCR